MAKKINLGLIGLGTVGGGVAELLLEQKKLWSRRLGAELVLAKAADLDLGLGRALGLPLEKLTTDAFALVNDPQLDIIIELIGGFNPAKDLVMSALKAGKHVVTANKALLAYHGREIFTYALEKGLNVAFEASVGGGIPLIRSLREGLAANNITSCLGILNGTCNYILSRMTAENAPFAQVLQAAQDLGYAEADPTFDIEGNDTAHKLALVAALVTGQCPPVESIPVQGITGITPEDIKYAGEFGYKIKLLAILKNESSRLELRVHPTLVPDDHVMASVAGAFNAIHIHGDWVGEILLYGPGAGRRATASAVVGDVLDVARDVLAETSHPLPPLGMVGDGCDSAQTLSLAEISSLYYLRFVVQDKPGVLADITRILGDNHISLKAVLQKGKPTNGGVDVVMLTHKAREADLHKALRLIDQLPVVSRPATLIRVI